MRFLQAISLFFGLTQTQTAPASDALPSTSPFPVNAPEPTFTPFRADSLVPALAGLGVSADRMDSFINALSGLGSGGDKGAAAEVNIARTRLTEVQLDALCRTCGIARRITTILPEDATRSGWWVRDPSADVDPMADEDRRLNIRATVEEAASMANRYGNSFTFIRCNEIVPEGFTGSWWALQALPLDPARIIRVHALHNFDTIQCTMRTWDANDKSQNFTHPETYTLNANVAGSNVMGLAVHHTRIVRWVGLPETPRLRLQNRGLDLSVLEVARDAIRNDVTVAQSGATYVQDFGVPVLTSQSLLADSSSAKVDNLNAMTVAMARTRSLLNMILLAPGDVFDRSSPNISGFRDLDEAQKERLCASTGIPRTILYGGEPGGLSTDDKSGRINWYSRVQAYQNTRLRPHLDRIYCWLYSQKDGPTQGNVPSKWSIEFYPIEPMSDLDKMDIMKKAAEVDKLNIEMGLYTASHAAKSRYGTRGFRAEILPVPTASQPVASVAPVVATPEADPNAALATKADPAATEVSVSAVTYNGAQVTSAVEIITKTIAGELPRESGIAMLMGFFKFDLAMANAMIGPVTAPFVPPPPPMAAAQNVQVAPQAGAAPMSTDGATELPLSMQIPTGGTRSGISPTGEPWSVVMPCDYGEMPGVKGLDGEATDYLLVRNGPRGTAFVVEQYLPSDDEGAAPDGEGTPEIEGVPGVEGVPEAEVPPVRLDADDVIDEYKVILGVETVDEAKALLEQVYGDTGNFGAIYTIPESSLLDWLRIRAERAPHLSYDAINMKPPDGVREELKKGLAWHKEGKSGKGLVPATVAWARRLASGQPISPAKAVKMRAWLSRHEVDKKGEGYKPGEDGFPSPGRVAWALWGGDAAVAWSNKIVGQLEAAKRA
jgi:phage-related protein (TIGR01555 family)